VSGCKNPTVAQIIQGNFQVQGTNHGKPVYKKEAPGQTMTVLIYFWDERDGPTFNGWWFGPKVGGDQVWAYNVQKESPVPPSSNWQVPWDGPTDESLRLDSNTGIPPGVPLLPRPLPTPGGQPPLKQAKVLDHADIARREEERQRLMAEQKEKEEERVRMQEENRKRQEERNEDQKRRLVEQAKKREEDEVKRKEQTATLAVRKVVQRVRIATPENFDELRADLERVQVDQLEAMGSSAEKVQQEVEKALLQAQERINQLLVKRQEEEKKRLEEEQQRKVDEEKVAKFTKQITDELVEVELHVEAAEKEAKPIDEISKESLPEAMLEAVKLVGKVCDASKVVIDSASKSILDKRNDLGKSHFTSTTIKSEFVPYLARLTKCRRTIAKLRDAMKCTEEKAARKGAALKKREVQQVNFKKYDADHDGKLSRKELVAFSKSAFDFDLNAEHTDKVLASLGKDGGIPIEKFKRLRAMIAIARSEAIARKKREEEEERRRLQLEEEERQKEELSKRKAEVGELIEEADKLIQEVEGRLMKAENDVKPLGDKGGDGQLGKEDILALTGQIDEETAWLREALANLEKKAEDIEKEVDADESLQVHQKKEASRVRSRLGSIQRPLDRVVATSRWSREQVAKKEFGQREAHRTEVVGAFRTLMAVEENLKTCEDLYGKICDGDEVLTSEKFVAFLGTLPDLNLEGEDAETALFAHIAGPPNGGATATIDQAKFAALMRCFFKVVKGTVLSETFDVKSKTKRRLVVDEVVEVIEGPKKDDVGLSRVRCASTSDSVEGWVTIAGNQGTVFLEPGGNLRKCVADVAMTEEASVSTEESKEIRKLQVGEIIEVLDFGQKDKESGLLRIKGKAKSDDAIGWISAAGDEGQQFLEMI